MVNRQVNRRDKGRHGFMYDAPDPKKVKERAETSGGNFDSIFKNGIDSWRPKAGDNQIRILPATWENHDHFGHEIWVHGYVGADKSTYLCREKTLQKRCPICDMARESKEAGETEEFDQLKAKKRYVYWIIDRDGDMDMPQVWSVAWTQDRDIADACLLKKTGKVLHIVHPDHGYDLTFKRHGTGFKTRYGAPQIDRDESPIDESKKKQQEILDYIVENPLPDVLKIYSAEHLAKAMEGTVAEKDEDLDDDRKSRKGKSERVRPRDDDDDKPKRRGRAEDEDEEEKPRGRRARDDDEDDKPKRRSSRDDDEDEKPKSRRGRDDDEDDKPKRRSRDDDEEDEKPKSRRRDDDEDDRPKRRSRDDDEEEDKPKRRGRDDDEDDRRERARDDDDDKPKRRSSRDDDEDDKPKRRGKEDDDDDKPKRRGRDDDEEEDRPSRSRRGKTDDDDDKPRRRSRD